MRAPTLRTLRALSVAALLASSATASGAILNVDTTVDDPRLAACDDATPNDCSLRGAIIKANALTEAVTINVPAGTYILSQATPCFFRGNPIGALYMTQALCPVGTLNLIGAGGDVTIIDANQPSGNIFVQAPVMLVATTASVRVKGMTLRHGNYSAGSTEGHGGAINNAGTLVIEDSVVSDNYSGGAGGGIFNQRDLTVLRSVITRNFSVTGGGGIVNTNLFGTCQAASPCQDGQGILTIADSTISENVSGGGELGGFGAGVMNADGVVDIVGSTISGNVSNTGSGGGIYNAAYTVNLTNVTVSGNRAALGGGIMNTGPTASVLHLNNVTIANNTAQRATDPTQGIGGGLVNGAGGTVTLANTIIAGNFAAGNCAINGCVPPGNDCLTDAPHGGALTSEGYNLVQDTQACDIFGDTIGNITGQDPKLGVLADNGGWTLTHAIGEGSVAVDAGDPAAPGSGGAACAILDQRGFPRPLGAACDIGALEHSGVFAITRIIPASGGNAGSVTALVSGNGFSDGSSIKLTRGDTADIVGNPAQVDNGGSAISTTFDLGGAAPGSWNVVVTRPDASAVTLANAFTVQAGGRPDLWIDVPPFGLPRAGFARINIFYGNRGNVDAFAVPLQISAPDAYGLSALFPIEPPPAQPDQRLVGYSQVLENVEPFGGGHYNIPVLLPVVPAGFTGTLQVLLLIPQPAPTTESTLFLDIDTPYFNPTLSAAAVAGLVQGAMAYSPVGFHIEIDPALVPALQQYVTNQLQLVAANGRNAFVQSLGTSPQIYSHNQLVVDTAVVGAWRTLHP